MKKTRGKRGFSLVELIIVIVIIGVLAAIAIPRVSRGSKGAGESALVANLAVLRNAVEMYASEHDGKYPGAEGDGSNAAGAASMESQLTKYSNDKGVCVDTRDADHPYGPYLRKGVPPLPVGDNKGSSDVLFNTSTPPAVTEAGGEGWVYNSATGEIVANSAATSDTSTKKYNEF